MASSESVQQRYNRLPTTEATPLQTRGSGGGASASHSSSYQAQHGNEKHHVSDTSSTSTSLLQKTTEPPAGVVVTGLVIIAWYACNIALLLLTKFLLTNTRYEQPCFLTLCHMMASVIMGLILPLLGWMPIKALSSRSQAAKIGILSLIFCATIILGNASLQFIPVSFNQAIGSTTPFFTAILALVLQGSRESLPTYLTLIPVIGGIAIASGGEPLFHLFGFTLCLMAVAFRATKTVIQSILMTDPAEKLDPSSLQMYMSICCIFILVPVTYLFEPEALDNTRAMMVEHPNFSYWLVGNSMLAFFVNLTNLLVTKFAGPLTLQVIGNAKGVVCAVVSVLVFRNPVTAQGILGYVITVFGTILYSESKKRFKPTPIGPSQLDPVIVSAIKGEIAAGNESGWQRIDTSSPNKQGSPKQARRY